MKLTVALLCTLATTALASSGLIIGGDSASHVVCVASNANGGFQHTANLTASTAVSVRAANGKFWIPTYEGIVYSTTDGITFDVALNTTGSLSKCFRPYDIIFTPSGKTAVVVCDNEEDVWLSQDGGQNFQSITISPFSSDYIVGGAFLNDTHGALTNSIGSSYYTTTDGGSTWTRSTLTFAGYSGATFTGVVAVMLDGVLPTVALTGYVTKGQTVSNYYIADAFNPGARHVNETLAGLSSGCAAAAGHPTTVVGTPQYTGSKRAPSPGVFSTDGGRSWTSYAMPVLPNGGIFGSQVNGVYVTEDGVSADLVLFNTVYTAPLSSFAGADPATPHWDPTFSSGCELYSIAYL